VRGSRIHRRALLRGVAVHTRQQLFGGLQLLGRRVVHRKMLQQLVRVTGDDEEGAGGAVFPLFCASLLHSAAASP